MVMLVLLLCRALTFAHPLVELTWPVTVFGIYFISSFAYSLASGFFTTVQNWMCVMFMCLLGL